MKKSKILTTGQMVVLLGLGLVASTAWSEENLRVGLARSRQIEIRCDGPFEVILDGRTGESKELEPGVYTLGVVEAPSFFRAAPLVAGVISTPPQEIVALSAIAASSTSWNVDLVRTPSAETAARAEKDARRNLKGRIRSFEEDGQHVVQMGPFPNEYLARKAEEKARSAGFPARVTSVGDTAGYANDLPAGSSPQKSRRLQPAGQSSAPVSLPAQPVPAPQPDSQPALPESQPQPARPSAQPQPQPSPSDTYEGDLAPLDLIPEEMLQLEPEATATPVPPPEPPVIEPIPEPQPADMGPELGWVPAPEKKGKAAPPPERIDTSRSTLPRPPQRLNAPSQARQGQPKGWSPERQAPPRVSPAPQGKATPAPSAQRRFKRPRYADGRRRESPPPTPRRYERLEPREKVPVAPAPTPAEPPRMAESAEPEPVPAPILRPMPAPEPKEPEYSAPPRIKPKSKIAEPYKPKPAPESESYAFTPKRERFRIPNVFKSLPIIRRFWWQDPLVGKPLESTPPTEDLGSGLENALNEPLRTADNTAYPDNLEKEPGLPSDLEPSDGKVEPEWVTDGTPPEAEPAAPDESAVHLKKESEAGTTVETPSDKQTIAPYEVPKPAELPKESTEPPQLVEEDLTPSEPGESKVSEPVEPKEPDSFTVVESPTTGVSPVEPGKTVETRALQRKSGAKTLLAAPTKAVARSYVQIFDDNGKPVSDPATMVDVKPLASSKLEFSGHSYHGTFQVYAPSDEWLVLVNQVDIEDYLAGVVPQEIPPEAPFEVLKAQAVMCRCYALQLVQSGENAEYGYDIPGDPESEWPYYGRDKETSNVRLAVEETLGEILLDSTGNLATPVYCFSSGGYVADGQSIWGSSGEPVPEYLEARPDFDPAVVGIEVPATGFTDDERLLEEWLKTPPHTFDQEAAGESFRWKRTLTTEQMNSLVNDYWNNQVGEVKSISITERAISGHATRMTVVGTEQTVEARDSDAIREALQLDSSLILIKEDWRSGWTIYGGGLGHGVGLSQCGAIGLVKSKGANYKQILHFYFSKLKLGRRELVRSAAGV